MGKIGLFGGTFDPPHIGHIALADAVLSKFSLDKIIFIPAGNPPHKTKNCVTDKNHRFKMISLATENKDEFLISDFDLKNEKPNYSYITIEHFKAAYPDDEIFFIVGADSYRDFFKWKNYPEILTLCTYIVVNRKGADVGDCFLEYKKEKPQHKALFLDDFSCDVSSTEVRKKLSSGKKSGEFLHEKVYQYIKNNALYN